MKILYLSIGSGQDYLRDSTFHGLRTLFGPDVVDVGKMESMYQGCDVSACYGRGMTLYGLLPDLPVDRTDIPAKIRTRFFDLIVYGSIHRHHDFLHEASSQYPSSHIAFLDGEDHPGYLKGLGGIYFKRELHSPQPGVFPIQFSIPAAKILPSPPLKSRMMAPMDPLDVSTYIYTDEPSYYAQYASSHYAATMMKAGWDCLRHYEILSQWTLPYFRCLDQCPATIMARLPKRELRLVQECFDYGRLSRPALHSIYDDLISVVMDITRRYLTTEAMATYILDTVGVTSKETVQCV